MRIATWEDSLLETTRRIVQHQMALGFAAVAAGFLAITIAGPWAAHLLTIGLTTGALVVIARVVQHSARAHASALTNGLAGLIEDHDVPTLCTDATGRILYSNRSARTSFGPEPTNLLDVMAGLARDARNLLHRMQGLSDRQGSAEQEIDGTHGVLRLSVRRIAARRYVWQIDRRASSRRRAGAEAVRFPMMTASAAGRVLSMNAAMRAIVGSHAGFLDRIFSDLPLRSGGLHRLSTTGGRVLVRVFAGQRSDGAQEIFVQPVSEDDAPRDADAPDLHEDLPVALIRLTPGGYLTYANRLARRLLGETRRDMPLHEILEGPGRSVEDWIADAVRGIGLRKPEVLRLKAGNGEAFLQVVLDRAGTDGEDGLIAVLNDATEMKSLEAQFVQSQKMQAIGQLAGGIAHDFNNLLTAISGHCDLLLLRHDEGDAEFADLMQIQQNTNRAAALVGQLLAFSRKQSMEPEILDLRETLSDITHLLNRLLGERINLQFDHPDDLAPVKADRRQIEQVIINLCVNARDAMPDGGDLKIETCNRHLSKPERHDEVDVPPGDYVIVSVVDQGIGIPPEKRQKIFEPFYTTKPTGQGTGLGLSTVYGIVKQTGGYVFVDSVEGAGTVFSIWLPAQERVVENAQPRAPATLPLVKGRREGVVLLVEDEAPVRAFAARALQMQGLEVIDASSAEEALDKLRDPSLKVDLFITDVVMPGLDGPTWVERARRDRPDVKVIFMSGYSEDDLARARDSVPNASFLPKPFSLEDLANEVRAQLG